MKNKNLMIIGGIALAIGAYMWYKKNKLVETPILGEEPMSNFIDEYSYAEGTSCKCANGVTGYCGSGDCTKCCGEYGVDKPISRGSMLNRETPYKSNILNREAPYKRSDAFRF